MSGVFISYKRDDEWRVAVLLGALERGGLDVWWDKEIPAAERWRERILTELELARCVLVVWSEASTGPAGDFVRDEAQRAKQRGTLLQVRIDDVPLPLGFGEHQALDLIGWKGDEADPRLQDIAAAAKALIAGGSIPARRLSRPRRTAARAAGKIALLVTAAGFAVSIPVSQTIVCRIPGLRGMCRDMGIGGVPSRAEEALWSSRRAGDCEALRSFLSRFPHGAYAAEGQTRLAAAKSEINERWATEERRLRLVVGKGDPFPSEQAAQADALARAPKDALGTCFMYNQGAFRLLSARGIPQEWQCTQRRAGHACGFEGQAVCQVKALHADRIETCP